MNPLADVDTETLISGNLSAFDSPLADALSHYPLESIETEYPHYVGSVDAPDDFDHPAERHPIFYGCFDWHSAVHSHWALVRQLRLFDSHPRRAEIIATIDDRFTAENVDREIDYLKANPTFERPYGWAWLLHLVAELSLGTSAHAERWRSVLEPLEEIVVDRLESSFLTQPRPFRVGTHGNSAFALHCVLDYARTVSNASLEAAVVETATEFFADDRDYPVEYEPLGWDFLSPALTEANLMRRVYDADAFETWFDGFLPELTTQLSEGAVEPIEATDDSGLGLHFVGLNLARAWCLAGIAETLDDDRSDPLRACARRHARAGVDTAFTDDYAGAHWLSSFVLYLLSRNDGCIARS